jgi:uncharacterized protein (TIGR02646 family)
MIRIFRRQAPEPNETLRYEKKKLEVYLKHIVDKDVKSLSSRSFFGKSIAKIDRDWHRRLFEQFNGKCAFCETKLSIESSEIEYYRPVNGVIDEMNNSKDYDHYYVWLTYEWTNLLLSCKTCSMYKKNYFPVSGQRVVFGKVIQSEKALLLDPCSDSPEQHLYFDQNGWIHAKSEKGSHTIELLQLNRSDLLKARKEEAIALSKAIEGRDLTACIQMLEKGTPYFAFKKYELAHLLMDETVSRDLTMHLKKMLISMFGQFQNQKQLRDLLIDFITDKGNNERVQVHYDNNRIEEIVLKNIRGINIIHKFKQTSKDGSWLMILGENGTGKTTFLQALTLAVTERWNGFVINPDSLLHSNDENGYVAVKFTGVEQTSELYYDGDQVVHKHNGINVPIAAYGAVRLFPKFSQRRELLYDGINVRNLFPHNMGDYFLAHPSKWIKDIQTSKSVSKVILDVLPFNEEDSVDLNVEGNQAYLLVNGKKRYLHELSSGYQNIIALTIDILRTIGSVNNKGQFSEGLVIIDELDAHLHPTWKLIIVNQLKKVFPYMQFIVTSHDPLCLRGLTHEELLVMQKVGGEQVRKLDYYPDPKGMRIDQILTSSMFGLDSTLDFEVDQLIKRYYYNLNKENKTDQDLADLEYIEARLDEPDIKYLGYTNREKLIYQIIDKDIARRKSTYKSTENIDEETQRKLLKLWNLEEESES